MKKLGFIVPYRDRKDQLEEFLEFLDRFILFGNNLNCLNVVTIVVNQNDRKKFNRGKLLNIGFIEAKKQGCDYVVFHDVDMLPMKVDYTYSEKPLQLANTFIADGDFTRTIQRNYFGGVTMFTVEDFEKINGYSNKYKGWGFEDDDLLLRCREVGLELDIENYRTVNWDRSVIKFDGEKSNVRIPNTINYVRPYTIVTTFYPNKLNCNPNDITDEFSPIGIPGHDLNITYTSFNRVKFEFFLKNNVPVDITSDYYPPIPFQVVASINPRKKRTSLYINGKEVGVKYWGSTAIKDYKKEPYVYIGASDPNRKLKQKFFSGYISNVGILDIELTKKDVKKIFLSDHNRPIPDQLPDLNGNWISYYDADNYQVGDNDYWLDSIKGSKSSAENCTVHQITTPSVVKVQFPYRRNGKYRLKKHEEAGYTDGYWKDWSGRENQLKFYRHFNSGESKYKEDGLTTCKYRANLTERNDKSYNIIILDAIT